MLESILRNFLKVCVPFECHGFDFMFNKIKSSNSGSLILSNHPSYIDPVILFLELRREIEVVPVVGENIYIAYKKLLDSYNPVVVPNFETGVSSMKADVLNKAIKKVASLVKKGKTILVYPSGKLQRENDSNTEGSFFIPRVLDVLKQTAFNCFLVKAEGAWDSVFSFKESDERGFKQRVCTHLKNIVSLNAKNKISKISFVSEEFTDEITACKTDACFYETIDMFFNNLEKRKNRRGGRGKNINKDFKGEIVEFLNALGHKNAKITNATNLDSKYGLDSLDRARMVARISKKTGYFFTSLSSIVGTIESDFREHQNDYKKVFLNFKKEVGKLDRSVIKCEYTFLEECSNLVDVFLKLEAFKCNTTALIDERGSYTFGQIAKQARLISSVLAQRYSKDSKYIGVLFPLCGMGLISLVAVLMSGNVPVLLSHQVFPSIHVLKKLKISYIVSSYEFVDKAVKDITEPIFGKMLFVENILLDNFGETVKHLLWSNVTNKHHNNKVAVVLLTSGVSGQQKIVPLTHKNIMSNIAAYRGRMKDSFNLDGAPVFNCLPLFHSYGLCVGVLSAILSGIPVVTVSNPVSPFVPIIIKSAKPSIVVSIPSVTEHWIDQCTQEDLKVNTRSVFVLGAEPISSKIVNSIRRVFTKSEVWVGYGLTECSPVISCGPVREEGAVGGLLPNVRATILNEDCAGRGILAVRGPSIFAGYFGSSGKKEFTYVGSSKFFITNDVCKILKGGEVFIEGRQDRMVKVHGEKVSLQEVEQKILDKFNVKGAVVFIEDVVYFVCESDAKKLISFRVLNSFLREISVLKVDKLVFLSELPMLSSNKISLKDIEKILLHRKKG